MHTVAVISNRNLPYNCVAYHDLCAFLFICWICNQEHNRLNCLCFFTIYHKKDLKLYSPSEEQLSVEWYLSWFVFLLSWFFSSCCSSYSKKKQSFVLIKLLLNVLSQYYNADSAHWSLLWSSDPQLAGCRLALYWPAKLQFCKKVYTDHYSQESLRAVVSNRRVGGTGEEETVSPSRHTNMSSCFFLMV